MKQFFVLSKVFGILTAAIGLALGAYVWVFIYAFPIQFDLIGPLLWKYPVLDWLVTGAGVVLGLLGFIYAVAEKVTWRNALFGLPLFIMNTIMVYTWWHMELGLGTDLVVASVILSISMLFNFFAAAVHLLRRFELPTIQA